MLQEEIMKLGDYFRGIEYFNDALIVKVNFPQRWKVFPSENGLIKPAKSDETSGEYFYYGNMNSVSLDDIFSLIKDTIEANKDAEMKIKLLAEKYNELQELFKKNTYEKLLTLTISFEEVKKDKPKRKYTRKKKTEDTSTIVSGETIIDIKKEE